MLEVIEEQNKGMLTPQASQEECHNPFLGYSPISELSFENQKMK
jgi:hypothetical protein